MSSFCVLGPSIRDITVSEHLPDKSDSGEEEELILASDLKVRWSMVGREE